LALAGFSVGASVTGVMVSQTFAIWKLVVAPLTMVLLWGVLLPVAHRLWLRRRFVSTRPKGRMPLPIKLPRPNPVFISSLDANLESDGLMGPSMPPPSQGGIAIIGAVSAAVSPIVVLRQEPELPLPPSPVSPSIVPQSSDASRAPTTDRSPAEIADTAAPPNERDLEQAAAALERSSEVIAKAEPVAAPVQASGEAAGPLVGAAASLNPPAPALDPVVPHAATDSIAAHIASLLGQVSGFSEFPSVSSESELEQVVASVSARLGRDLPSNDYMGPSADLRAMTIAPMPEPEESTPTAVAEAPAVERPVPVIEALLPALEAPQAAIETAAVPAAEAAPIEQPAPVAVQPVPEPAPVPVPVPESYAEPVAVAFASVDTPRLVFKRVDLDQGCAPRVVHKCAIPITESCSPAPRRTSLRPSAQDHAVGEAPGPSTLRGLG
ncbi:MAG TPA: hypothetical protein VGL19_04830, partial [Polyangiaceae bacterium]